MIKGMVLALAYAFCHSPGSIPKMIFIIRIIARAFLALLIKLPPYYVTFILILTYVYFFVFRPQVLFCHILYANPQENYIVYIYISARGNGKFRYGVRL
jgi:hypothetical protein